MLTRRARIRGSLWQDYQTLCLAISVGKPVHEGDDLAAAIEMIAEIGRPCVIRLSDTLQRHNYMADGLGVMDAWQKARDSGTTWIDRNAFLLNKLPFSPIIARWDSVISLPDFEEVHSSFCRIAKTNPIYSAALDRDINAFISRRVFSSTEERNIVANRSKAFLLEEAAGQTILGRQYNYACFYPGKSPEVLDLARSRAIDELPNGLENTAFIRFSLETRHAPSAKRKDIGLTIAA